MKDSNSMTQIKLDINPVIFGGIKIFARMVRIIKPAKTTFHFDKEILKGKPFVLLADHSSYNNNIKLLFDFPISVPIHAIVGACHPRDPKKGLLLKFLGVIPKKMYVPDLQASLKMMHVIKKGEALLIYPEGMYSYCGVTHPINPVIAGFLKAAKVDIVVASFKGGYLSASRVAGEIKKGPVSVDFYHLYTPEQLKKASTDEIYENLMSTISYNEYKWNAVEKNKYIGKIPNADGFQKVLYRCPRCGEEGHMYSEGNKLICDACGNAIIVDETYSIAPATEKDVLPFERIDQWYYDQRCRLRKEVRENENFEMKLKVKYDILNTKNRKTMFLETGEGEISINRRGVAYKGTNGQVNEDFLLPIKSFFGSSNQQNRYMVMFRGQDIIAFDIGIVKSPMIVKACGAIEELHALIDPDWDRALKRVYPYNE